MHDSAPSLPPDVARRVLVVDGAGARFVRDAADAAAAIADVALAPDADPRALALDGVARVTLTFAKPADGRAYTQARILRDERGYRGKLRATGAVLVDALHFMKRAGFDEFILRDESDEDFAVAALTRFSVDYQRKVALPSPASSSWRAERSGGG